MRLLWQILEGTGWLHNWPIIKIREGFLQSIRDSKSTTRARSKMRDASHAIDSKLDAQLISSRIGNTPGPCSKSTAPFTIRYLSTIATVESGRPE